MLACLRKQNKPLPLLPQKEKKTQKQKKEAGDVDLQFSTCLVTDWVQPTKKKKLKEWVLTLVPMVPRFNSETQLLNKN